MPVGRSRAQDKHNKLPKEDFAAGAGVGVDAGVGVAVGVHILWLFAAAVEAPTHNTCGTATTSLMPPYPLPFAPPCPALVNCGLRLSETETFKTERQKKES